MRWRLSELLSKLHRRAVSRKNRLIRAETELGRPVSRKNRLTHYRYTFLSHTKYFFGYKMKGRAT